MTEYRMQDVTVTQPPEFQWGDLKAARSLLLN